MIEINGKNFQDSEKVKRYIIELMENYHNSQRSEESKNVLTTFLKECSINSNLKRDYEDFKDNQKNKEIDISEYKYCWYVKSNHDYGYCINKKGMMILLKLKNTKQYKQKDVINKNEHKNDDYKEIGLKNGYIDENNHLFCIEKLSTSFDIYEFMKEAGWLDGDQSYILAENLKSDNKDKLEIHHINNRPDDNRVDNLIWLPRSIHCQAHKYSKIYTFELTNEQYDAVIKCLSELKTN